MLKFMSDDPKLVDYIGISLGKPTKSTRDASVPLQTEPAQFSASQCMCEKWISPSLKYVVVVL